MNGVNLEEFQFEYDLTWMAFFQNEKGQTYTRYGGREDRGPETHLTKASLVRVMRQVLELHKNGDVQIASRFEPKPTNTVTPSDVPTLKPMMAKRKDSSCIHCHDVKVARLRHKRDLSELKKSMVFTYPTPKLFGLHVDPDIQNRVAKVETGSAADKAGIESDDILLSSGGQRILTFGDFTRVLEFAPDGGKIDLKLKRGDAARSVSVDLPKGWKQSTDPSWRPSLGMVGPGGGFWGRSSNAAERKRLGLTKEDLAIRVTFIWAPHAKATGIRLKDVVVSIDGQTNEMNMRQLHGYLQLNRKWGDTVPMVVRRGDRTINMTMRLPSEPLE